MEIPLTYTFSAISVRVQLCGSVYFPLLVFTLLVFSRQRCACTLFTDVFHHPYTLFSFSELFCTCVTQCVWMRSRHCPDRPRRSHCFFLGPCRKDFEELFDVIITNALKPGFFSLVPQQRPFRTLGE